MTSYAALCCGLQESEHGRSIYGSTAASALVNSTNSTAPSGGTNGMLSMHVYLSCSRNELRLE